MRHVDTAIRPLWSENTRVKFTGQRRKSIHTLQSIHFLIMAMNKSPFHSTLEFFSPYISLDTALETDVQSHFEFHPRTSKTGDSTVDSASTLEWTSDSDQNVCWLQQERKGKWERERQTFFHFRLWRLPRFMGEKSNIGIALAGKGALVFRLSAQS